MARHRRFGIAFWLVALASMPYSAPALGEPCCRFENFYLFPSGPNYYQCCSGLPDFVLENSLVGVPSSVEQASPRSSVTINEKGGRALRRGVEQSCVKLSDLTPLERLLRSRLELFGTCFNFVVYDHFPCSCQTRCDNVDWLCDCPGIPPGQLPEIGPQDSLHSQPEFLGTTCTPCNTKSTCSGSEPPPPPPPA
ncbi:MAG: hypothetical protein ACRD2T_14675 [Thermoanaerobaculia bacterium]